MFSKDQGAYFVYGQNSRELSVPHEVTLVRALLRLMRCLSDLVRRGELANFPLRLLLRLSSTARFDFIEDLSLMPSDTRANLRFSLLLCISLGFLLLSKDEAEKFWKSAKAKITAKNLTTNERCGDMDYGFDLFTMSSYLVSSSFLHILVRRLLLTSLTALSKKEYIYTAKHEQTPLSLVSTPCNSEHENSLADYNYLMSLLSSFALVKKQSQLENSYAFYISRTRE